MVVTTEIVFELANLIFTIATVGTSYIFILGKTIGIYAVLLILYGVINLFGVYMLCFLSNIFIILYLVEIAYFAVAVFAKAPTH